MEEKVSHRREKRAIKDFVPQRGRTMESEGAQRSDHTKDFGRGDNVSGLDVVKTEKLEHMTACDEDLIGLSVDKVARDRMSDGAGVL